MTRQYDLGTLVLDQPLVTLDTETTGTDIQTDRIVEIALVRLAPNGVAHEYSSLVNPGMQIPDESAAIHGITDAKVASAPTFDEIAEDLLDMLTGADLAGYNHIRFDLPLLQKEFQRVDIRWDYQKMRIVDAQTIFHKMEPRTLTAAYRYFCDRDLEEAHSALADTRATLEVLLAQIGRYEALPKTVGELDAMFNQPDQRFVDPERRFRWRNGEPQFNFGERRGISLREVADQDPEYLDWILRKDFSDEVKSLAKKALQGIILRRDPRTLEITEEKIREPGESPDPGNDSRSQGGPRSGSTTHGGQ